MILTQRTKNWQLSWWLTVANTLPLSSARGQWISNVNFREHRPESSISNFSSIGIGESIRAGRIIPNPIAAVGAETAAVQRSQRLALQPRPDVPDSPSSLQADKCH